MWYFAVVLFLLIRLDGTLPGRIVTQCSNANNSIANQCSWCITPGRSRDCGESKFYDLFDLIDMSLSVDQATREISWSYSSSLLNATNVENASTVTLYASPGGKGEIPAISEACEVPALQQRVKVGCRNTPLKLWMSLNSNGCRQMMKMNPVGWLKSCKPKPKLKNIVFCINRTNADKSANEQKASTDEACFHFDRASGNVTVYNRTYDGTSYSEYMIQSSVESCVADLQKRLGIQNTSKLNFEKVYDGKLLDFRYYRFTVRLPANTNLTGASKYSLTATCQPREIGDQLNLGDTPGNSGCLPYLIESNISPEITLSCLWPETNVATLPSAVTEREDKQDFWWIIAVACVGGTVIIILIIVLIFFIRKKAKSFMKSTKPLPLSLASTMESATWKNDADWCANEKEQADILTDEDRALSLPQNETGTEDKLVDCQTTFQEKSAHRTAASEFPLATCDDGYRQKPCGVVENYDQRGRTDVIHCNDSGMHSLSSGMSNGFGAFEETTTGYRNIGARSFNASTDGCTCEVLTYKLKPSLSQESDDSAIDSGNSVTSNLLVESSIPNFADEMSSCAINDRNIDEFQRLFSSVADQTGARSSSGISA